MLDNNNNQFTSLPFLKRAVSPTAGLTRSATLSFSTASGSGSGNSNGVGVGVRPNMGSGPPTRFASLVPERRPTALGTLSNLVGSNPNFNIDTTMGAGEQEGLRPPVSPSAPMNMRPVSTSSGDFVLIDEPEEFDIPKAEWDLPRIPGHSLGIPSQVDLSKTSEGSGEGAENNNGAEENEERGEGRVKWSENTKSSGSRNKSSNSNSPLSAPPLTHTLSGNSILGGPNLTLSTSPPPNSFVSPPAMHSREPSGASGRSALSSPSSTNTDDRTGIPRPSSDALLDLWGRVGA